MIFSLHAASVMALTTACTAAAQMTDQVNLNGETLQLFAEKGQCLLAKSGTDLRWQTKLAAPCRFVRRKNGALINFSYPKKGVVIVIAGAPASQKYLAKWPRVTLADQCADQAQGVIVDGAVLTISKDKARDGLFCPNIGVDEKVYYGFAFQQ